MGLTIIKNKNKERMDQMCIGSGHTVLLGNVPEPIQAKENLTKLNENYWAWNKASKESIQSLGFFGSDIDYNTYYPDLKAEDLKPKESEFITPMFRLLSATIVSKNFNPTDFSRDGVLKASMKYLLGQTVNCDHETNIGNAIGSVSHVVWQDAYKDKGFEIPAGINGILKIDGKANPRIARGILMDPPSIHSNSVTVQFKWDKSHPDMDDNEFLSKLGTYDDKGNMVRRIVTEVVRYFETSLVSHGADSFAQKVGKDGKIVNPTYAKRAWSSYKEYEDDSKKEYFFSNNILDDFKNDTQILNHKEDNNSQQNNMDKELQEFLEKLFGKNMLTLAEGKEKTPEEAISLISGLISSKTSLTEQVTNLTSEKESLEEKVKTLTSENASYKEKATIADSYISKLRENTVADYKKILGEKFDEKDPIYVMLNDAKTQVVTLQGLAKSYHQKLEEMFPLKCNHCGSKDVSRASSVEEPDTTHNKEKEDPKDSPKDTVTAMQDIINRKERYTSPKEEDNK